MTWKSEQVATWRPTDYRGAAGTVAEVIEQFFRCLLRVHAAEVAKAARY